MYFYTSCTLTTLKYIQVSFVWYCPLRNYTKIFAGKLLPIIGKIWMNPAIGCLDPAVGLLPRRSGITFNPTVG